MSDLLFLVLATLPLGMGIVALYTGSIHTRDGHHWRTYYRTQEPTAYWIWVSFSFAIGSVVLVIAMNRFLRG